MGDQRRRLDPGDGPGSPASGPGRRGADEMEEGTLEETVDPLPTRIDDARFAQDRQQAGRPGDGLLGGGDRGGQRMTVRIVPSTGLATAPYAVFAPSDRAWARSRPLNRLFPPRPSAMPRKIWLVMTPELPRAPISAPKLMAAAIRSVERSGAASASSRAALTVAYMLVPVSPSGTG